MFFPYPPIHNIGTCFPGLYLPPGKPVSAGPYGKPRSGRVPLGMYFVPYIHQLHVSVYRKPPVPYCNRRMRSEQKRRKRGVESLSEWRDRPPITNLTDGDRASTSPPLGLTHAYSYLFICMPGCLLISLSVPLESFAKHLFENI